MVFDSILKDIHTLQDQTKQLMDSKAVEDLENHLSERIATLTENSLEVTATQRESLQNLMNKIDQLEKKYDEKFNG